jgi:hypothetical protein
MDYIWLIPLILGSIFAISGGQEAKWKAMNFLIIAGCMAVGFGIGYAAGLGSANLWKAPNAGLPFALMFGIVAAFTCVQMNSWRAK